MLFSPDIIDILALAFVLYLLRRALRNERQGHLPPGPTGWPVIGNILDMPASHEWRTFASWGDKWGTSTSSPIYTRVKHSSHLPKLGDIMSVNLFGKRLVILNSFEVANELLDKKSIIYSDRPVFPVCGEVIGWNRLLALQQYGVRLREMRRLFSQTFGTHSSLMELATDLEHEAHQFLRRVAENPSSLTKQVQR